jgi:hypothetical protein
MKPLFSVHLWGVATAVATPGQKMPAFCHFRTVKSTFHCQVFIFVERFSPAAICFCQKKVYCLPQIHFFTPFSFFQKLFLKNLSPSSLRFTGVVQPPATVF